MPVVHTGLIHATTRKSAMCMPTPEPTAIFLQRKSQSNAGRAVVVICIHNGSGNHARAVSSGEVFNLRDTVPKASQ